MGPREIALSARRNSKGIIMPFAVLLSGKQYGIRTDLRFQNHFPAARE